MKCNKTIQLLRIIAHTDWGGDKQTLLKLYWTLTTSKLDYRCFIYSIARKTYLKEQNTIHNQELRLVLRAFNTSLTKRLYKETLETPLSVRWHELDWQYFTKFRSCSNNSAFNCLIKPQHKDLFKWKKTAFEPFDIHMENNIGEL